MKITLVLRRAMCCVLAGTIVLLVLSSGSAPGAATPEFIRVLQPDDARAGDEFGWSVALDGRLGVIGAPGHDAAGTDSGAAYVFDVLSGQQLWKLTPNDGREGDMFGISVSIDGDFAIVGAALTDSAETDTGSAYLFDLRTGQQVHKLTADDGTRWDEFGFAVDILDDLAIVGAHKDDAGSAYVFDVATGTQLRKLRSVDAALDDRFGVSVALDGHHAAIGARFDDDQAIASGSAYLFDVRTGDQLQKYTPHDGDRGDRFGQYLDIEGDRIVVGSRFDDDRGKSSGAAYIYDVESGQELRKILGVDTDPKDHFGSGISIDRGEVLIGAVNDSDLGIFAGSAYLFDIESGEQLFKFTSQDPQMLDLFGQAVAMDEGIAIIGASMTDYAGAPRFPSGKVEVWVVPEPIGGLLVSLLILLPMTRSFTPQRRRTDQGAVNRAPAPVRERAGR